MKEKYLGEASLLEKAKKKLGLIIKNGSITSDKMEPVLMSRINAIEIEGEKLEELNTKVDNLISSLGEPNVLKYSSSDHPLAVKAESSAFKIFHKEDNKVAFAIRPNVPNETTTIMEFNATFGQLFRLRYNYNSINEERDIANMSFYNPWSKEKTLEWKWGEDENKCFWLYDGLGNIILKASSYRTEAGCILSIHPNFYFAQHSSSNVIHSDSSLTIDSGELNVGSNTQSSCFLRADSNQLVHTNIIRANAFKGANYNVGTSIKVGDSAGDDYTIKLRGGNIRANGDIAAERFLFNNNVDAVDPYSPAKEEDFDKLVGFNITSAYHLNSPSDSYLNISYPTYTDDEVTNWNTAVKLGAETSIFYGDIQASGQIKGDSITALGGTHTNGIINVIGWKHEGVPPEWEAYTATEINGNTITTENVNVTDTLKIKGGSGATYSTNIAHDTSAGVTVVHKYNTTTDEVADRAAFFPYTQAADTGVTETVQFVLTSTTKSTWDGDLETFLGRLGIIQQQDNLEIDLLAYDSSASKFLVFKGLKLFDSGNYYRDKTQVELDAIYDSAVELASGKTCHIVPFDNQHTDPTYNNTLQMVGYTGLIEITDMGTPYYITNRDLQLAIDKLRSELIALINT